MEIDEILKDSKEPTGVVVRSADGRTFFLTDKDAKRTEIRQSSLYEAYLRMSRGCPCEQPSTARRVGGPPVAGTRGCRGTKKWLDSHRPNTARWRRIVLWWANHCL